MPELTPWRHPAGSGVEIDRYLDADDSECRHGVGFDDECDECVYDLESDDADRRLAERKEDF